MLFRMVYKSGQIFLPFCHNPRMWQTDRWTDRTLLAIPRLHYMQHGKNTETRCNFFIKVSFGKIKVVNTLGPKRSLLSYVLAQIMLLSTNQ